VAAVLPAVVLRQWHGLFGSKKNSHWYPGHRWLLKCLTSWYYFSQWLVLNWFSSRKTCHLNSCRPIICPKSLLKMVSRQCRSSRPSLRHNWPPILSNRRLMRMAKERLISFNLDQSDHGHPEALHDDPWRSWQTLPSFHIQNQTRALAHCIKPY